MSAEASVLYRCANAEARAQPPGMSWKLNRSKPALLAEAPKLLSQDSRFLAEVRHPIHVAFSDLCRSQITERVDAADHHHHEPVPVRGAVHSVARPFTVTRERASCLRLREGQIPRATPTSFIDVLFRSPPHGWAHPQRRQLLSKSTCPAAVAARIVRPTRAHCERRGHVVDTRREPLRRSCSS